MPAGDRMAAAAACQPIHMFSMCHAAHRATPVPQLHGAARDGAATAAALACAAHKDAPCIHACTMMTEDHPTLRHARGRKPLPMHAWRPGTVPSAALHPFTPWSPAAAMQRATAADSHNLWPCRAARPCPDGEAMHGPWSKLLAEPPDATMLWSLQTPASGTPTGTQGAHTYAQVAMKHQHTLFNPVQDTRPLFPPRG